MILIYIYFCDMSVIHFHRKHTLVCLGVNIFYTQVYGVRQDTLTIGNGGIIMPYFALCVCFVNKPWTVCKNSFEIVSSSGSCFASQH